jgi:hypothetical protein
MDPTTIATLQTKAYNVLTTYLQDYADRVLSIEILPEFLQPPDGICMREGLKLAIPKKTLALAFIEARKRFLANKNDPISTVHTIQCTHNERC